MDVTEYPNLNSTEASEVYVRPFGEEATILSGVLIFTFLIIGVTLNSITIAVVLRTPKLQSVFMSFIVSLCFSDLISALISPLFWYRRTVGFDVWTLPNFFCKLYWSADMMTSCSTAMHILSFAFLRYISIQHSSTFAKISVKAGKIWIMTIWFIAFTCGFVPFFVFFGADPGVPRDRFSNETNAKWPACTLELEWLEEYTLYTKVGYTLFLLVPMFGVIVLSLLIASAVHIHSSSSIVTSDQALKQRIRKERQAVLQLTLIVASFLFGYLPYVTYEMWSLTSTNAVVDYWFGLSEYFCLRFSECMNPVFYNISSAKMRRHTRRCLKKHCKCYKISISVTSVTSAPSTPQRSSASVSGDTSGRWV